MFALVVDLEDVLVVKLADAAVATVGGQREVGDDFGVGVGRKRREVGVPERDVELGDLAKRRLVDRLDEPRGADVRLCRLNGVEPAGLAVDVHPEP